MDVDINVLLGGVILACGSAIAVLIFMIRKLHNRTNAETRRGEALKARLYNAQGANDGSGIVRYISRRRDV